jgi:hypothetical protein
MQGVLLLSTARRSTASATSICCDRDRAALLEPLLYKGRGTGSLLLLLSGWKMDSSAASWSPAPA